ncbi:MAG: oxaloacetate decarboxylase [Lautropia sp.]
MANPLRALLRPGGGVLIPGAANALAARIAQHAGFEVVMLTGAGLANTFLGVPDIGLTTHTEVNAHLEAMREAISIPIIVDGDSGFGNAVNTYRTVRAFERAGADAIQLEDQTFPKRCGHFSGKHVIPMAEMVHKIEAACDARRGDMLILARTDAYALEGLDRALERARAYQEAGADLLFVEAPITQEELARIPRDVPGPHMCNMVYGGRTPLLSREHLAQMGYAGIIYANAALQASMLAMKQVLGHLHAQGSLEGAQDKLVSFAERQANVDFERYAGLERRYGDGGLGH